MAKRSSGSTPSPDGRRRSREYRLFTFKSGWCQEEKANVPVVSIKCGACENREEIRVTTQKGSYPPEWLAKKFTQRGWNVGRRERDHRCQDCQRVVTKPAKEVKTPMAQTPTAKPTLVVEEPPTAGRADRRKIMDALEENYNVDANRYSGTLNDQAIAEKLGVPRAWVTEIREQFFGDEDNEVIEEAVIQLEALTSKISTIEDIILKASDTLDGLTKQIQDIGRQVEKVKKQ